MSPARRLLLNNKTCRLAKKHFPVGLRDVLVDGEWILLDATSLAHQQCPTQIARTHIRDTTSQLRWQVQAFLATDLLQDLDYLSVTYNHQCAHNICKKITHYNSTIKFNEHDQLTTIKPYT